ncbi:MAG: hypothetical protein GF364_04265 [Candidatus Lokiarchaeota archaeon]|nr:hypothetical protein [Candidatus Lokiarchaeota archaeon]
MLIQTSEWESWLLDIIEAGYIRGVHLVIWISAIAIMYVAGAIFLNRSLQEGLLKSQMWVYRSFGLFFILMGITRILFVLGYFIEPFYNFLLALGYAFGALSLLPLVITLEKWLIKWSRHFFSIVGIILTILSFYFVIFDVSHSELSRTIQEIGMPIMAGSFLILYMYLIKITIGAVRKKAILTLIGMTIFVIGIVLDGERLLYGFYGTSLLLPMMFLSPAVFISGILLMLYAQRVD